MTDDVARAATWQAGLSGDDATNMAALSGTGVNDFRERRTVFWDDAAKRAAGPDYQQALEVVLVGLAGTAGVPVSDLAARVAATGARQDANFDLAGFVSFAIVSLGIETLVPLLDGPREGLSDADIQTLEDLRALKEAMKRRDREEHGWP